VRHLSEDQLILYYYGESESAETDQQHLNECESCLAELEALELTLSEVVPEPVPERPADYGQRVWRRLEPELTSRPRWSWLDLFRPRQLAWAAAAATLLAAVFFAGRISTRWDTEPEPPSQARARVHEGVLLIALGEHLESSQILLMELANRSDLPDLREGDSEAIDISFERQLAEDLVGQNRLYRQTADRAGEAALATVLDELERMLIDIAHSPDALDVSEFEYLRDRIEAQGVLFKVKVLTTNVKKRQRRLETVTRKKL
jgi:hypothetical protein